MILVNNDFKNNLHNFNYKTAKKSRSSRKHYNVCMTHSIQLTDNLLL